MEEHQLVVTHELSELKIYNMISNVLLDKIAISAKRVRAQGHHVFCLSGSEDKIFVYDVVNRGLNPIVLCCTSAPSDFIVRLVHNTVTVLAVGRDKQVTVIQVPHNSVQKVMPLAVFSGHKDFTCCVEVGVEDQIYCGGCDCKVIRWQWDESGTKATPVLLSGHTDYVLGLAYHSRTKQMASCSRDGTVRLWTCEDDLCVRMIRMSGPSLQIQSLDNFLVCILSSSRIAIITENPNEKRLLCVGHAGRINQVLLWNKTLLSCSSDNSIRSWDTKNGAQLSLLRCHNDAVNAIRIHQDILLSASDDTTVKSTPMSIVLSSNPRKSRKSLNFFQAKVSERYINKMSNLI